MTNHTDDYEQRTLEELLPTPKLAKCWVELLRQTRDGADDQKRERQFLFAHGWLRGLADADLLSDADLSDLRELLINASHTKK